MISIGGIIGAGLGPNSGAPSLLRERYDLTPERLIWSVTINMSRPAGANPTPEKITQALHRAMGLRP